MRITVVYNEPEVSRYNVMGEAKAILGVLDEVEAVSQALTELGYSVARLPLSPPLEKVKNVVDNLDCQVVFNLFQGFEGSPETEIAFARILSARDIPYTGCPPDALAIALDKSKTKALFKSAGINTPLYQVLNPGNLETFHLEYPCIVKPCNEDASHGLGEDSVVRDFAALSKQVYKVSELFGGSALVEEFIDGREFNATVMGKRNLKVLQVSEIVYSLPVAMPRVLTFAAKWEPESVYFQGTRPECPAKIEDSLKKEIIAICKASFRLLGCMGYARVDMRQDAKGKIYVLEINPNPDLSPGYGAALQAQVAGMSYSQFIEKIVMLALDREQYANNGLKSSNQAAYVSG